jgi:hypothetical protein
LTGGAGRPRARVVVAGVLLAGPLLAACGGAEEPTGSYSARAAQQLSADVARVRTAAEDRRPGAARAALHRLTRHVAAAQANGELPPLKARRILQAADLVAEDLAALPDRSATRQTRPVRPAPRTTDARDRAGGARAGHRPHDHRVERDGGERHRRGSGGEKPEGWEAHKGAAGSGEKPEGWEAHKGEGEGEDD